MAELNPDHAQTHGSPNMDRDLKSHNRTVTARIELPGRVQTFRAFDTPLSRAVCTQVLTGKSYPLAAVGGEVRTILDVGANIGAASVYFALHYPQARILAFEPSPRSYELLLANTKDFRNVTPFNLGLLDRDAELPLYQGRQDSVTDSIAMSCENTAEHVMVKLRAAASLLAEQKVETVNILKLDTEGSEVPILQSLRAMLPRLGVLYVEYHDDADRREIDRLLAPTHVLWQGQMKMPHRGELCYILTQCVPPTAAQMRIVSAIQQDRREQ